MADDDGSDRFDIFKAAGSQDLQFMGGDANTEVMRIKSGGNVGIGTSSPSYKLHVNGSVAGTSAYVNLSDGRLKKNIVAIEDAVALVERLRGVRFAWRTPAERTVGGSLTLPASAQEVGFIAQEVQAVLPEAVSVAAGDEWIMSVAESKIVPVLVEAIKEQQAQLRAVQAELRELRQASGESLRKRTASIFGWR
jgi:hypothetical protein